MKPEIWHEIMGQRDGACIVIKTRYGMVRVERIVDHRGQLFSSHGSVEGFYTTLEAALEAALKELAVREQEQRG